nr:conjugal transfer protein TrbL family protein [Moorella glycerini]
MENALTSFVSFTGNEMALALQILDSAYVQSAVHLAQAVAGSLLAVKVGAEALQAYILHTHGDPGADPGGLLKRTAVAAAIIGAGPWLVKTVYTWGNDLAQSVANLSAVNPNPVNFLDTLVSLGTTPTLILIADIAALGIWVLILIQTGIRAVEVAALAAVGPFMAVGLTRADEGVAAVWWRELVVLSGSQALQTFLVKGFLATIVTFTFNSDVLKLFLLIGWLWVAFKTPAVLRQFAYHTGLGGAMGQAGQTAGTMYIMRRMFMRG